MQSYYLYFSGKDIRSLRYENFRTSVISAVVVLIIFGIYAAFTMDSWPQCNPLYSILWMYYAPRTDMTLRTTKWTFLPCDLEYATYIFSVYMPWRARTKPQSARCCQYRATSAMVLAHCVEGAAYWGWLMQLFIINTRDSTIFLRNVKGHLIDVA